MWLIIIKRSPNFSFLKHFSTKKPLLIKGGGPNLKRFILDENSENLLKGSPLIMKDIERPQNLKEKPQFPS